MDYIFCARNIRNAVFGTDPGPTRFLEVPNAAATLHPSHAIPRRAWFDKVVAEAEVTKNPHTGRAIGDILIYVHGFNNSQATMLERHRRIRKGLEALGYKGIVVSFDWPCAESALNYLEDRTDAKLTAIRLVDDGIAPFSHFIDQGCEISVHILAHSMGAYVLREAFDDADDRPAVAATSWSVSQVMLAAGDVSADSMGISPKSSSLYRHCVRLTNYANPYDAVLSISNVKRVGVSPRVGRIGLPAVVPPKAVNVDVGIYYDDHREDFAGIPNADHSWYFYDPNFLKDVYFTMQGVIDRESIPTRFLADGKLYLRP
ncbi:MAG: alpha/beta hydrolase [Paracoccaceae bacterium]